MVDRSMSIEVEPMVEGRVTGASRSSRTEPTVEEVSRGFVAKPPRRVRSVRAVLSCAGLMGLRVGCVAYGAHAAVVGREGKAHGRRAARQPTHVLPRGQLP